jgi:uncharacterized protein (TIGR02284 family)
MLTEQNEELVEVLNDLIKINNDRIVGYERAIQHTSDNDKDLVNVFTKMIDESRQYKMELSNSIQDLNGRISTEETTHSGKLYRVWMDLRNAILGKDRQSVLDECEFGEDTIQKVYREAIESDATRGADIRRLITNQKSSLKISHDTIKRLRDTQKELDEQKQGKSTINH